MTATHPMSDAVAQGIVAQLEANLPAQIQVINAEAASVADGFLLRVPIRSAEGKLCWDWTPSPGELGSVPVLGLQYLGLKVSDDVGHEFTGTYRHVIIAHDAHPETRGLARLLRRWERAVTSCFGPDRNLPAGAAHTVRLGGTHPGPTLEQPDNPGTWLSWVGVEITSVTDEN